MSHRYHLVNALHETSRRETRYCREAGKDLNQYFKRHKQGQRLEPLDVEAGSSFQLAECPVQAYESFPGSSSKQ